jgi:transcriptional regulator with XRE-family HTH domain
MDRHLRKVGVSQHVLVPIGYTANVNSPNEVLGRNVRRLRKELNLSISSLARAAGISKATLLNIEAGDANPTVETLHLLAVALDASLANLVTDEPLPLTVQRLSAAKWVDRGGARLRTLSRIYGYGLVQVFTAVIGGDGYQSPPHAPGTLEHVYVVTGHVQAGPLGQTEILGPGDLIRFPADRPHVYNLLSPDESCSITVFVAVPSPPEGRAGQDEGIHHM